MVPSELREETAIDYRFRPKARQNRLTRRFKPRNPKPETRNPKPETRNPPRNPQPEIRKLKPETRNPKSITRYEYELRQKQNTSPPHQFEICASFEILCLFLKRNDAF